MTSSALITISIVVIVAIAIGYYYRTRKAANNEEMIEIIDAESKAVDWLNRLSTAFKSADIVAEIKKISDMYSGASGPADYAPGDARFKRVYDAMNDTRGWLIFEWNKYRKEIDMSPLTNDDEIAEFLSTLSEEYIDIFQDHIAKSPTNFWMDDISNILPALFGGDTDIVKNVGVERYLVLNNFSDLTWYKIPPGIHAEDVKKMTKDASAQYVSDEIKNKFENTTRAQRHLLLRYETYRNEFDSMKIAKYATVSANIADRMSVFDDFGDDLFELLDDLKKLLSSPPAAFESYKGAAIYIAGRMMEQFVFMGLVYGEIFTRIGDAGASIGEVDSGQIFPHEKAAVRSHMNAMGDATTAAELIREVKGAADYINEFLNGTEGANGLYHSYKDYLMQAAIASQIFDYEEQNNIAGGFTRFNIPPNSA